MINYDDITKGHNPNLPHISDQPYRILITGGSGSGKTNALFNVIKKQDLDIIVLSIKLIYMLKIQMKQNIVIIKDIGFKQWNDLKALIEY